MFEQQRKFEGCKDKNYLPFDFYLPTYNTIIEFDGRQHFGEVNYFKSPYELTKLHDEIKNEFCHNNHINLLRIPYWRIDKIEKIIDDYLA